MKLRLVVLLALAVTAWGSAPQAQDARQFYLSPIDGAGTDADPWRSRCVGGIDLRPFVGIDYFLCASTGLPGDTTGVEQLGASAKSSIASKKGALAATIKKSVNANTVDELVLELLSAKLRPGRDGKVKIYLGERTPFYQQTAWVPFEDGGLVADLSNAALGLIEPTLAWAASFADTFTGADGNLAGDLTWTEFLSTEWARVSNSASASGATASAAEARAEHDTSTDDQSVQADMTYVYASSGNFRCAVLARKDSTTTRDFYQWGFQRDTGVNVYRLLERNNGSPTTLGDSSGATASPATLKIVVDGTSISGYVGGVLTVGPITDGTVSGNTRGGITYTGGSGDSCTADNVLIMDAVTHARGGSRWFP